MVFILSMILSFWNLGWLIFIFILIFFSSRTAFLHYLVKVFLGYLSETNVTDPSKKVALDFCSFCKHKTTVKLVLFFLVGGIGLLEQV